MNKKAFTLIELLAVIAILAIIMVIAVPTVLNTVSTAKKGAFKDNALSVIKAVENKIMTNALEMNENINILDGTYMMVEIKDVDIDNKTNVNGYVYVVNMNNEIKYYISMYNKEYIVCQTEKNSITTSSILDNKTNTCNDLENFMFNNIKDSNNKLVTTTNTDTSKILYDGTINNLKIIKQLYVGPGTYFVLYNDNTLYGWGTNTGGQLCIGNSNNQSTPVKINTSTVIEKVIAYNTHTLLLSKDGIVYSCGENTYGQLGDGTKVNRNVPTEIKYFSNNNINIIDIYAGVDSSYALSSDNDFYSFGRGNTAQLGTGNYLDTSTPIKVNIPNNYKINNVMVSTRNVFLLLEDGYYYGFGASSPTYGNPLGTGASTDTLVPTKLDFVGFTYSDIKEIKTMGTHTMFLLNNGSLYTSGYNNAGQLGDGTVTHSLVPKKVNLPDKVSKFYSSRGSIMVQLENGDYYAWGSNSSGLLGDGTTTERHFPVKINIKFRNINDVICSTSNCILKLNDNTLYTVGSTYIYDKKIDFPSFYYGN